MEGLTWRMLTLPEYVMTFLESFLILFLPAVGAGNALDGGGVVDLKIWPSAQTLVFGAAFGVLNGIRSLRNLRAPAPAQGVDRRQPPPAPTPPPGG